MIPQKVEREVHTKGVLVPEEFKLTMSPHMASLLSDKLYTDKVAAVIREYSCNARDANVQAGNATPINVHLPTPLEPWFSVKDQGVGLDFAEIGSLFCTYGSSTKQNSNATTGMFGVGSKAGFAYTDQFTVIAIKDGMTERVSCFKDREGMPQYTRLGDPTPTNEPNGVTVQVPVKPHDMGSFEEKASKILYYFDPVPTFNTGLEVSSGYGESVLEGAGWKLYNNLNRYGSNTQTIIVTAQVPYTTELTDEVFDKELLSGMALILTVPTGSVDIAASREEISLNEQTIKYLAAKLVPIIEEIKAKVTAEFDGCATKWERYQKYASMMGGGNHNRLGGVTGVVKLVRTLFKEYSAITWAPFRVLTQPNTPAAIQAHQPFIPTKYDNIGCCALDNWMITRNKTKIPVSYEQAINIGAHLSGYPTLKFLLYDTKVNNLNARVKHQHSITGADRYLLIRYPTGELPLVKELFGYPPDNLFLDLGEIDEAALTPYGVKEKVASDGTRLQPAQLLRYDSTAGGASSKSEEKASFVRIMEEEMPKMGGYYVQIKDYRVDHPTLSKYPAALVFKGILALLGVQDTVYAIFGSRKNWFEEREGWVNLATVYDQTVAKIRGNPKLLKCAMQANFAGTSPHRSTIKFLTKLSEHDIMLHECDSLLKELFLSLTLLEQGRTKLSHFINSSILPIDLVRRYRYVRNTADTRLQAFREERIELLFIKYPVLRMAAAHWWDGHYSTLQGTLPILSHLALYMEKVNEQ